MKKWIMFLMIVCVVFGQDENLEDLEQNFLHYIHNDEKKEEFLLYLEDMQNQNSEKTKLLIYLISKYRTDFLENNKRILSARLCRVLLKHISEDLQICIFEILSSLDEEVLISHSDTFSQFVANHLNDGSLFMDYFSHFFLLEKGNIFPDLLPLIIMDEEVMPKVVGKILLKYESKSLLESIVKILVQNPETINFQVTLGLEYCERVNYAQTIDIISEMFEFQEINSINLETKKYILDTLSQCIENYVGGQKIANIEDVIAKLKIRKESSKDILITFIHTCNRLKKNNIFSEENLTKNSLKIMPILLFSLESNCSKSAIEIILALDDSVLNAYQVELEKILETNKNNPCYCEQFLKLVFKMEKDFLRFFEIVLTSEVFFAVDDLVRIFFLYQIELSSHVLKALKSHNSTIRKRALMVLYGYRDSGSFFTENFFHITDILYSGYMGEQEINIYNQLQRRVDFMKITKILLENTKQNILQEYYFTTKSDLRFNVRNSLIKILNDGLFVASNHNYMEGLKKFPVEMEFFISQNTCVLKNLLQVITKYKIDREDAAITILYCLIDDPKLEQEARNALMLFTQEQIRKTITSEGFRYHFRQEQLVLIRQKLMDIFGKDFFAEENKE